MKVHKWVGGLFVGMAVMASAVKANIIYEYQGSNFAWFSGISGQAPYSPNIFDNGDAVHIKLTFSEKLVGIYENYPFTFNSLVPPASTGPKLLAWELDAGPIWLSSAASSDSAFFTLLIASSGVTGWNIEGSSQSPSPYIGTIFSGADSVIHSQGGSYAPKEFAISCQGDLACLNRVDYPFGGTSGPGSSVTPIQGKWTIYEESVPEPSGLALLAIGLVSLIRVSRSKCN
jgi:hypothetical protein